MSNALIHLSRSNQPAHIRRGPPRKEESCLRKVVDSLSLIIFDLIWGRIIKDFYIPELDLEKKPRIFGMTASPVDANEDVVHAARLEERIEDARSVLMKV